MSYTPDAQTSSVFASLILYCSIGALLLLLFEWFRSYQNNIFKPRIFSKPKNIPSKNTIKGPFKWIILINQIDDNEMLSVAGLDGYVLIRFIRMSLQISISCFILSIILLLVYSLEFEKNKDNANVVGINIFTMGNLLNRSKRLWASWLFAYIFYGVFLYCIHMEYMNFSIRRQEYFKYGNDKEINIQTSFSVFVENIPKEFQNNQKLFNLFNDIFPGQIYSASIAINTVELDKLIIKRNQVVNKLEKYIALKEAHKEKKSVILHINRTTNLPIIKIFKSFYKNLDESDSIDYYNQQLNVLNEQISKYKAILIHDYNSLPKNEQGISLKDSIMKVFAFNSKISDDIKPKYSVTPSGFITFKTKKAYNTALTNPVLFHKYTSIRITQAYDLKNIIWENLAYTTSHVENSEFITSKIYTVGLLFWGVIIAFVSAVSTLSNLSDYLPFINNLNTATLAIIGTLLPVVIMSVFLALIPIIMYFISYHFEKRKFTSQVQEAVFKWYYLYQIANVYLLLIGGSLFNSLAASIANPSKIIVFIGASVPTVSIFFINYIISSAFIGTNLVLLRLVPFIIFNIYKNCFNEKKMTRNDYVGGPLQDSSIDYSSVFPNILYILSIMLLEWIIAPIVIGKYLIFIIFSFPYIIIILAVASIYFGYMYLVWKYQLMYVVVKQYESNGKFWYSIYSSSMIGLLISSITFIVYMGIKQAVVQTPLLLPLPLLVLGAWRYTEDKCLTISLNPAYSCSVEYDDECNVCSEFKETYFHNPSLDTPDIVQPYPYRVNNLSLFDATGNFRKEYYNDKYDNNSNVSPLVQSIQINENSVSPIAEYTEEDCK